MDPDSTVIININPQVRLSYSMKRGDIILVSGTGIVSWLIKRITKSKWSHVAWILGKNTILESDASQGGVVINPIQMYVKPNNIIAGRIKIIRIKKVDPGILDKAIDLALEKVGEKYDYSSIAYITWAYFLSIFGIRINVGDLKSKRHTCVELIARPMKRVADWQCFDEVDMDQTVPEHFDLTDKTKDI